MLILFAVDRALAISLLSAGTGFGNFVLPQIVGPLVSHFGWRGSMRIQVCHIIIWHQISHRLLLQSAIVLGVILAAFLVFRRVRLPANFDPATMSVSAIHQHHRTYGQLLRDPLIVILGLGFFLLELGLSVPVVYLVKFSEDKLGLSSSSAAWTISAIGGASVAGRLLIGLLAEVLRKHRVWLFVLSITVSG